MEGVKEADCARRGIICFGAKGKIEQPTLSLEELPSYNRIHAEVGSDQRKEQIGLPPITKSKHWKNALPSLSRFFAKNKNVGKNCFR